MMLSSLPSALLLDSVYSVHSSTLWHRRITEGSERSRASGSRRSRVKPWTSKKKKKNPNQWRHTDATQPNTDVQINDRGVSLEMGQPDVNIWSNMNQTEKTTSCSQNTMWGAAGLTSTVFVSSQQRWFVCPDITSLSALVATVTTIFISNCVVVVRRCERFLLLPLYVCDIFASASLQLSPNLVWG